MPLGCRPVPARTLFIGLDACDCELAREFARDGDMPTLARLLETAAVQPTLGPLGFLVGGNWPTTYTGLSPARHQFLCTGQVRGGTYEARWIGPISEPGWPLSPAAGVCVTLPPEAELSADTGAFATGAT